MMDTGIFTGGVMSTTDTLRRAVWRVIENARNARHGRAASLAFALDEANTLSAFSDDGYTVRDVMGAAGGVATVGDVDDLRSAASSSEEIQDPARRLCVELLRVDRSDVAAVVLLALLLDLRRAGFDGDANTLCAVVSEMNDRATQRGVA